MGTSPSKRLGWVSRTASRSRDSIIYATAQRHHAELWTHDAHFRGLDGVRFVDAPADPRD